MMFCFLSSRSMYLWNTPGVSSNRSTSLGNSSSTTTVFSFASIVPRASVRSRGSFSSPMSFPVNLEMSRLMPSMDAALVPPEISISTCGFPWQKWSMSVVLPMRLRP